MNEQQVITYHAASKITRLIISGAAITITLPMRRLSGKDHIGAEWVTGMALILFYAGYANAEPLMWLMVGNVFAAIWHRLGQVSLRMRGIHIHTRYDGEPWLARILFFNKNENTCKQAGEPLIAMAAGFFLLPTSEPVGFYLMFAGLAAAVVQSAAEKQRQRRIDDMRNGMLENQDLMSHFPQRRPRRE